MHTDTTSTRERGTDSQEESRHTRPRVQLCDRGTGDALCSAGGVGLQGPWRTARGPLHTAWAPKSVVVPASPRNLVHPRSRGSRIRGDNRYKYRFGGPNGAQRPSEVVLQESRRPTHRPNTGDACDIFAILPNLTTCSSDAYMCHRGRRSMDAAATHVAAI